MTVGTNWPSPRGIPQLLPAHPGRRSRLEPVASGGSSFALLSGTSRNQCDPSRLRTERADYSSRIGAASPPPTSGPAGGLPLGPRTTCPLDTPLAQVGPKQETDMLVQPAGRDSAEQGEVHVAQDPVAAGRGRRERLGERAVLELAPAEGLLEIGGQEGERLSVDAVDRRRVEDEGADRPRVPTPARQDGRRREAGSCGMPGGGP